MTAKKTTTTKKKNLGGRPTKFTKEIKLLVKYMLEHGATDKEVAKELGVTDRTFYNWRNEYPTFFQSLRDWKIVADEQVEVSLYQRAKGYTVEEEKVFCDTKTGKITTKIVKKHFPPDPTSMVFWLKNRKPKDWRDKREVELSNDQETKTFSFTLEEKPKE